MPSIHSTTLISASPEDVWDILVDPVYAPKLYQDMLFMEVKPSGHGAQGQVRTAVVRAGRTKIEIIGVVTDAVRPQRFVVQQLPGGLFASYREEIHLADVKIGTEAKADFRYELSLEYLGGALNLALVENAIGHSLGGFLQNLKEITELKPMSTVRAERERAGGASKGT